MQKPIVPREIRTVYQGRVFTVQVETITLPKGGELNAEIVRHPGSVVIVPVTARARSSWCGSTATRSAAALGAAGRQPEAGRRRRAGGAIASARKRSG